MGQGDAVRETRAEADQDAATQFRHIRRYTTVTHALRLPRNTEALRFPPGARCIAYVRVSTERQAGEAKVSPETQLQVCRRLAAERGLAVEHVVEHHESGAHLARLDRLVEACKAHRLPLGQRGLICVYDTSRWGRFED